MVGSDVEARQKANKAVEQACSGGPLAAIPTPHTEAAVWAAVEAAPREIAVEAVYYTKAHPSSDPAVEAAEAEDVASMRPASCR